MLNNIYYNVTINKLSNGNLFVVGYDYAGGNYNTTYCILDQSFNVVKNNTTLTDGIYSRLSLALNNDGNIFICGYTSNTIHCHLIDTNGNIIKEYFDISTFASNKPIPF